MPLSNFSSFLYFIIHSSLIEFLTVVDLEFQIVFTFVIPASKNFPFSASSHILYAYSLFKDICESIAKWRFEQEVIVVRNVKVVFFLVLV